MKKILAVVCFAAILAVTAPLFAALPDCVDHGGTCVIGGTACCDATDSCSGKFPNTSCQ